MPSKRYVFSSHHPLSCFFVLFRVATCFPSEVVRNSSLLHQVCFDLLTQRRLLSPFWRLVICRFSAALEGRASALSYGPCQSPFRPFSCCPLPKYLAGSLFPFFLLYAFFVTPPRPLESFWWNDLVCPSISPVSLSSADLDGTF